MDVRQYIESEIKNNDVVLFMKGIADLPMCGFSAKVVNILKSLSVKFKDIDVLKSEEIRQGIKDYSDWPTIPQLYVKGEFVGGCDIVSEMYTSNELVSLFEEKSIITKSM